VDITLPLVSLSHEQICHMSADAVLITHCISTKDFLQDPLIEESTIAILSLDHADHLWCSFALVL
jgi:hypothetical protein